jgi:hypothetical protein
MDRHATKALREICTEFRRSVKPKSAKQSLYPSQSEDENESAETMSSAASSSTAATASSSATSSTTSTSSNSAASGQKRPASVYLSSNLKSAKADVASP